MTFHSIQFLRFVAAFLVVLFHMSIDIAARAELAVGPLYGAFAGIGRVGVPVFFVISGFVMYLTSRGQFGQSGAGRAFILRRGVRIYPIFWICAAIYLAFPVAGAAWNAPTLAPALLLLPGHASAIIPPGWTLAYELYFYAVFAVALSASRERGLVALTVFFLASIVAGLVTDVAHVHPVLAIATDIQLLLFLGGVFIGAAALDGPPGWLSRSGVRPVLFVGAILGLGAAPVLNAAGVSTPLAFGPPALALVAAAVWSECAGNRPVAVTRFAWLGDSSYALYLIHWLVLAHGTRFLLAPGDGPTRALAVGLLLSLACVGIAVVLHRRIEAPAVGFLRRCLSERSLHEQGRAT